MRQLRKSKVGVDSIAVQEFEDADADQSGELSVVEIFCLLPQVEKRFKMDLRSLAENEEESDSGKWNVFVPFLYECDNCDNQMKFC